jgi:hypothetical protein
LTGRRAIALAACAWLWSAAAARAQDLPGSVNAPAASNGFSYKFGVDYMLQASARRDYPFTDDTFSDDETFTWWRLRPRVTAKSTHLDFIVEGQDTHAAGGSFSSRKGWLDLLNAYADVKPGGGVTIRVGRQQADFEVLGRMVRTSDFAAVIRSFDVAQVSWRNGNNDVRANVMKPVDNLPSRFNREKQGERLWSVYGKRTLTPRAALQSYVIARHNDQVVSETGVTGSGAVYAWLLQATGPTPVSRIDWTVESVLERGHYSTDDVRAFGVFLRADADLGGGRTLDVRYTVASGDEVKGDGVRGQYDTFYAAANFFGALGQFRGSNVRSLNIGASTPITRTVSLNLRYWNTYLIKRDDLWYSAVNPNFSNKPATSMAAGNEFASLLSWQTTPRLLIRGGYYQFLPGAYAVHAQGKPREFRLQVIGGL